VHMQTQTDWASTHMTHLLNLRTAHCSVSHVAPCEATEHDMHNEVIPLYV